MKFIFREISCPGMGRIQVNQDSAHMESFMN